MKPPTILIVDDETRAGLYEFWLPDRYTVRTATSEREALSAIDRTVGVTVLRHEVPTEVKATVEARLGASSPANKLLLTTADHTPIVFPDVDADESLHEPICEETLVEAVERLLNQALYHEGLRQCYRYSMQRVNSRHEQTVDEAETADDESTLEELETRLARLTVLLDELAAELDPADVDAVLDALTGSVTFEGETGEDQSDAAKHRPDKCRSCGLVWGKSYGGTLGKGYSSLGAFTWRCRECGEVQNIPSPSDRRIARRKR